jgi:hypothetical protein
MIPGVLGQRSLEEEETTEGPPGPTVFWNSADKHADITLSNGDLTAAQTAGSNSPRAVRSTTFHTTGKHYYEFRIDAMSVDQFAGCGFARAGMPLTNYLGQQGGSSYSSGYFADGSVWQNGGGSGTSTGTTLSVAEWARLAIDLDAGKAWVGDAGGWVGDPVAGTGNTITFSLGGADVYAAYSGWDSGDTVTANFGATTFAYTVPAGFSAWGESETPAGDLAGTVALTFTPTADLAIPSGALSGTTSITFTLAGAMPFIPTDLGASLSLWYDASDSGSITQTGGLVDQLNDKSGNANHLTATSTARPATGANTLNSLNVLTYAGTNDVLARTASVTVSALHQTGATMVVVRKYSAAGNQGVFWTSTQTGSFGDNCVMGREGTNSGIWGNGTASSAGLPAAVSDTDNTNFHIQSGSFVSNTSREIFTDGTSSSTNGGNASSLSSPITSIFLGQCLTASRGSNMFLTGQIAEAILLAGSGTTNRQIIEGYVAHKWGLAGNLPVGHPYKVNPP